MIYGGEYTPELYNTMAKQPSQIPEIKYGQEVIKRLS